MKYTLYTLIYIIKSWDMSMDEFKPIGKFFLWLPNLLNNILTILFKLLMFPFIWLVIYLYDNNKRFFLRYFVYLKQSIEQFEQLIQWETNQ